MSNARMCRFEIFIGTWNTVGEVLETEDSPATTLLATDIYRWLPGRQFMVHDVDAWFGDDVARSMEIVGYDKKGKKYFARSYDDKGDSETFDVALSGRRWRISGTTTRFDGQFDATGNTLTGIWELKSKRSRWQPWIKLKLVRS